MAAADLVEFYRQLHLLTQSHLPLPESLRQLAADARKPEFRRVLNDLAEQTAGGRPLSDALAIHPEHFDPSFVRMIAASEKAGTLPETLAEIAGLAAVHQQLLAKTREIALYPLFTVFFAMLVMIGLYGFIVPEYKAIFVDLYEGARLPWLTEQVLSLSEIISHWGGMILVVYVCVLGYVAWLFMGSAGANRQLLGLIRRLPLIKDIFRHLQMAHVCCLFSVLMKMKMSLPEVFSTIAELMDDPVLAVAVRRLSGRTRQGGSLPDAIAEEPTIPGILLITVRHTPEVELPAAMGSLANLFRDHANATTSRATVAWEIIMIFILFIFVGMTVVAMFMPLMPHSGPLGA